MSCAAIWGRDQAAAGALAHRYDVSAHADFDDFLAGVDAVSFAVPPDVQSSLALRAAGAGKHLLLEKPIALTEAEARLVQAVQDAGVASVVFFTAQFQPEVRAWLAAVSGRDDWAGASAVWLGSALQAASPFNTGWRRDHGGLWDLGPHLIALLSAALGPVTAVTADRGAGDVTHLVLHHQAGVTSSITVTLGAPEDVDLLDVYLWGPAGRSVAPREAGDPVTPLRTALAELAANASTGQHSHPCDARSAAAVTSVLAQAQRQLDARPFDGRP